jgi:hypothetical protein
MRRLKRLATQPDAEESIADPDPAPVVKKKVVAKAKAAEDKKVATRSLGSKPVVLVPPSKKAIANSKKPKVQPEQLDDVAIASDDGGLYGSTDLTTANTEVAPPLQAAPKKKKTLADLFRGEDAAPDASASDLPAIEEPVVSAKPAVKKPQVVAPAPQQQASAGGFAVQLASFRSRNEASAEFGRLKAKHSGTLGQFSPIISEAQVGGSTRYRLSVGGMASQAQASAVCSSLFAGGERDCLVKRQ